MNRTVLYAMNFFKSGWLVSILAILPFIQERYGLSLLDVGFLSMTVTVVSIFVSYVAGNINDRIGSRATIGISILCYVFVWMGFWLIGFKEGLYFIYALAGISSGLFSSISTAMVARWANPEKRGAEIGNFSAVGDMGRFALVSVTTLMMGWFGLAYASLVYFAIAVAFLAASFWASRKERGVSVKSEEDGIINPLTYLRRPLYRHALFAGILDTFSSTSLYIFLPFLLADKGMTLVSTGFFTALFFVGYFVGRLVLGRLADRIGAAKVLVGAEICMAVLIASLVFINSYVLILANLFLLGIFTRGTSPVVKAMIAEGLDERQFEKGYSLYSSAMKTSTSLSRPAYAFVGNFWGIGSIFFASAVVALLTIVPAAQFYKSKISVKK